MARLPEVSRKATRSCGSWISSARLLGETRAASGEWRMTEGDAAISSAFHPEQPEEHWLFGCSGLTRQKLQLNSEVVAQSGFAGAAR